MGAGASVEQESWDGLAEDKRVMLKAEFDALVARGKSEIEAVQELTEKEQASVTEVVAPVDGEDRAGTPDVEKIPLTDLLEAIERAVAAGKTPLVVDRSEHGVVDTFFSYRSVQVLDAKKLGLDRSLKKIPVPELLDEARAKLVNALKYGFPFVVACQTGVPDFATTFNDDAARAELDAAGAVPGNQYLPLEVFAKAGRDLVTNDVTLASLFREADMADNSGMAVSRDPDKFHVIVTTRFSEAEFRDYLFGNEWGLPKPESQYRFIVIDHGDDVPLLT